MKKMKSICLVSSLLLLAACSNQELEEIEEPVNDSIEEVSEAEEIEELEEIEEEEELVETVGIDHLDFGDGQGFIFSSGAGAWGTWLDLKADGTFEGAYNDSNAGENGPGYLGNIYEAIFTGEFDEIEQIDDETYALKRSSDLILETEPGEERIEDQVKIIASEPYGIEESEVFYLYSPAKETSDFTEEMAGWYYGVHNEYPLPEKIGYWALHNRATDAVFFSQ